MLRSFLFGVLMLTIFSFTALAQMQNQISTSISYFPDKIRIENLSSVSQRILIVRFQGKIDEVMFLDAKFLQEANQLFENSTDLDSLDNKITYNKVTGEVYNAKANKVMVRIIIWDNLLIIGAVNKDFLSSIIVVKFSSKKKKDRFRFINYTLYDQSVQFAGLPKVIEINGFNSLE